MVIATLAVCVTLVGVAAAAVSFNPFGNSQVGTQTNGSVLLPTNQWITPYESSPRILDDNARLVSSTLSPDGKYLAALGWNDFSGYLTIVNLQTRMIVQQTPLETKAAGANGTDYSVGPDGPLFSSDGSTLWVPQSTYLDKFTFNDATGTATQTDAIPLCGSALTSTACNPNDGPSSPNGAWLPAGMALSPDGGNLYVALNGNNTLGVIDTTTDKLVNRIPVGNAPRQVVVADGGKYAYVSNEGGRPARPGEFTNLSDGTPIVADHSTGGATTGTVSVVDLSSGKETQEIPVGLEPTALYQTASTQHTAWDRGHGWEHHNGATLFVANSNDDSLSVIDENTNRVTQTVRTNPVPGADVGSYANAISMPSPDRLLVSIGRDNAIGVYSYQGADQRIEPVGLIPTDWYPVQVQPDPTLGAGSIVVTNDKGIGAQGPPSTVSKGPGTEPNPGPATGHNTYDDTGSVTTFGMPADNQLSQLTHTVFTNNAWTQIRPINQGDYDTVPSVIPSHLGGSSPIKHIVVIVKENRTYDQVLGDLGEGNGDSADAQFGSEITPNFHALARRFGDLDNFYDEGTLSADGHNWIVQAEANDYVEKEFGAFYRSYPSQGGDALAYQRDGFLWNAAEKAGLSVQNFGEYIYNPYDLPADTPRCAGPGDTTSPSIWDCFYQQSQWYENGRQGPEPIQHPCQYTRIQSDIPSLQAISDPCFPNFQLSIPDQYRVDKWLPVFEHDVRTGNMPSLSFMWLMTDHTGTTGVPSGSGVPYPVAQVADNDLAVGRVIAAISHSRFWNSTAIFVDEDDTQNGVDHVDGHRAPTFVVSPYSATGVDDQYYTQLNMVKTIEQILGIKPMNQEDEAAEPMYAAFTDHPDFTPYDAQPNQIPLTLGAPGYASTATTPATVASAAQRKAFRPEGVVPAGMRGVYNTWQTWLDREGEKGLFNGPDHVDPAQLNRFDWYSAHNWQVAYPGDPKIYLPNQVPGRNLPAAFIGNQ
jgi:YVTN family beta-propeller protein